MNKLQPIAIALLAFTGSISDAQTAPSASDRPVAGAMTARDSVDRAIQTSPDVLNRWNLLKASRDEQDAARGGWRPRVDLNMDTGRLRRDDPASPNLSYSQFGGALVATQMLFDSAWTRSEVARLGSQAQSRFYELLDTAESTALEAVRAHVDVLRYRKLVQLARDNYVQHKLVFEQISARVNAGSGRRVDAEQATGRLALAESNLVTELANLHDVSARYQRIVGSAPAEALSPMDLLDQGVSDDLQGMLERSLSASPAFLASIKAVDAIKASLEAAKSRFGPKVELRGRVDHHRVNDLGRGPASNAAIEVLLSMNLYRGGSDTATVRQQANQILAAQDLRDKACRDVRQNLTISLHEVRRLRTQLQYLEQHQRSAEAVRLAYRQQFDINQRSLLDLLDTENEFFQASRALADAQFNQTLTYAKVQAAGGRLLASLRIQRDGLNSGDEVSAVATREEMAACPAASLEGVDGFNKAELDAQADRAMAQARELALASRVAARASGSPQSGVGTGVRVSAAAELANRATESVRTNGSDVQAALDAWATAWQQKDVEKYLAFYSSGFEPVRTKRPGSTAASTRGDWERQRRVAVSKSGSIRVSISGLSVQAEGQDRAIAQFTQSYQSNDYSDVVQKTMHLVRENGAWRIRSEKSGAPRKS